MPNGKKSDRKLSRHRKNSRTLSLSPRGGHLTLSLSSLTLMGEGQKESRKSLAPNDKTLCVPVSRRAIQNPLLLQTKDQGNRAPVHNLILGGAVESPQKNRETKRGGSVSSAQDLPSSTPPKSEGEKRSRNGKQVVRAFLPRRRGSLWRERRRRRHGRSTGKGPDEKICLRKGFAKVGACGTGL